MKKKLIALALAAMMVFTLTACEVSSSSSSTTTVTTSTTDADGNTTTNTVTNEVGVSAGTDGVSVTNNTTTDTETSSDGEAEGEKEPIDWDAMEERLYSLYTTGAEGTNADGDKFFYAYNEDEGMNNAALMIVSENGEKYNGYEGTVESVEDHAVLYSEELDVEVPFAFGEVDEDGCFTMTFLNDGDVADMQTVDQDTIISDMIATFQDFMD